MARVSVVPRASLDMARVARQVARERAVEALRASLDMARVARQETRVGLSRQNGTSCVVQGRRGVKQEPVFERELPVLSRLVQEQDTQQAW